VTVAAAVLCAARFGLIAACLALALAVRPWLLLPFIFMIFRRATDVPSRNALMPAVFALVGAAMADLLSLSLLHPTGMDGNLEFALQVVGESCFISLTYIALRVANCDLYCLVYRSELAESGRSPQ
jgi:hypothetical protein